VQIPNLASINYYVHNPLPTFNKFLHVAQKSGHFDASCLSDKPEVLPILEMCGFRFWQFSGSADHIFQQISTKSHLQIKFSNAEFVLNGK